MSQLLTINRSGSITSLQFKKGKGFDLRRLGAKVKINRSSIIEWSEYYQAWYVVILAWRNRGRVIVTVEEFDRAAIPRPTTPPQGVCFTGEGGDSNVVFFNEYEDAVTCEVKLIQAIRSKFGAEEIA